MNHRRWIRKDRHYLYQAKEPDEISFVSDRIRLPSGKEFDYLHVECPYEVVFVAGIDHERHVLMLRQYRYLVNQELLEIPAGSPNPGETLEQGAKREFEEESGFKVGKLIKLNSYYSSIGMSNQANHIYLGLDLQKSSQALEEGELIQVTWMKLAAALKLVKQGKIMNVGTAYGLLLADLWCKAHRNN